MAIEARPRTTTTDAPPRENALAPIDHNRLPVEDQGIADFTDAIDGIDGLRQRIRDLVDSSTRAAADSDESAGKCAELIRQMSAAEKKVDDTRSSVKAPYLNAGRKIDDAARVLVGDLGAAKGKVRSMTETYLRQKAAEEAARARAAEVERARERAAAERAAREEAARAAEEKREPDANVIEAVAAVAAAPIKQENTQVRSDFGAMASARKIKVAKIDDWRKAFKAVENVEAVRDAVQKAINGLVRAGQTNIAGVTIEDDIGLSVR